MVSFAVTLYAGVRLLADDPLGVTLWLLGAAVLHDAVLLPGYVLADRAVLRALGARRRWLVNYVRVPAVLSGLLLVVYAPLILGSSAERYELATGAPPEGFAVRWLLISLALFAASAGWLGVRLWSGDASRAVRLLRAPKRAHQRPRDDRFPGNGT
ncbi:hypothetical protein [Streptomyces boninensis]|uniref:hypothetical protein n=1 Tax=Streptomyces boninensis TaxID=2039455 RepID=UPI003B2129FF